MSMTSAAQNGAYAANQQAGRTGSGTIPDETARSGLEQGWDSALDFAESDAVEYAVMAGSVAVPAAIAAAGAATPAAAAAAAGTAALPAAAAVAAGYVGGLAGSWIGEKLGDAVMGSVGAAFGYSKMQDAEYPATVGDPIAHVSKWATLGAMLLGAVAAVAVGALIVATAGAAAPLIVVAAGAAFAGGLVGGIGMGFASAAGQYGTNKGTIIQGSPNVFFENKPVARVTDLIECSEHGGPHKVAEGSETVFANSWPIARVGHQSTCSGKINDGKKSIGIDLTTSQEFRLDVDGGWLERATRTLMVISDFLPFPKSNKAPDGPNPRPGGADAPNVHANRPDAPNAPRPDATPANSPHAGDGPSPNRGPDGNGNHNAGDGPRNRNNDGNDGPNKSPDTQPPPKSDPPVRKPDESDGQSNATPETTTCSGDPIDVASGQVSEARIDISIPGTIPLVLSRNFAPGREGIQGRNWAGNWAQHLQINGQEAIYQDPDGVLITFHIPQEQVRSRNIRFPHLTLEGTRSGMLYIYDRRRQMFTIFEHEVKGRRLLTRFEDRNGNTIRFIYDANGLKEVRHSDGFSLSVESRNMVIRRAILNAPGSTDCGFVWNYNDKNVLTEVISAQTGTLRYTYDDKERLTSWADTKDTRAHYEYDENDRAIRNWSDAGYMGATLRYDLANKRTYATDAVGQVTIYDWQEPGVVWRTIDPNGGEWLTEWGRNNNVLSQTDPLGHVTKFTYDEYGDLISVTDPDGHTESWSYYVSGRIQTHTAKDGATHTFRYDNNGNLMSIQQPDGNFVRYRRAENGQVLRVDYPGNRQERFYYDMLQRLRMLRTAAGFEQHMRFDAEGRLTRFSDEIGAETIWDYTRDPENPRGNMRQVTLADGSTTSATYDSEGMLTTVTNGMGATRSFRFGALDLMKEVIDEQGHSLKFEHDPMTRLTAVVNQKGERYEMSYDACGRLVAERDYSGLVTRYEFDAAGWLIKSVTPDGAINSYTRSPAGLLLRVDVQRGTSVASRHLAYDAAGRLIRVESEDSLIEYAYDTMGRVISEKQNGREIKSEYAEDGTGRIARTGDVLPLHFSYNAAGQLDQLRVADHEPLSFSYDPRGLETMRSTPAGFALTQGYNNLGLLVEQIAGPLSALPEEVRYGALTGDNRNEHITRAGALAHRTYVWDRAQRAISINDRIMGEKQFAYDARGQVTGVMKTDRRGDITGLERFGYDPNQNLTEIATDMGREKVVQEAGRVKQRGKIFYRYDNAGRVIEKRIEEPGFRPKVWKMGWDTRSQLVRLETPEGAVWRYVYDALGRRVQRLQVLSGSEPNTAPEGKESPRGFGYMWEGARIVAEIPLGPDGTWLEDQAVHLVYDMHSFVPLARAANGELQYVVTDHIGTARELLAQDGSTTLWQQDLSLWGSQSAPARRKYAANQDHAPGLTDFPLRFQGQWHDEESGLYYNNNRYYDPDAAQYLTPDPLGLGGGLRPQAYTKDPNTLIDPLGLSSCPYDARAWRDYYEGQHGRENASSTTVPPRNAKNVRLAGQNHPRTGIPFDSRGYPIFDGVAAYDTTLPVGPFRADSYTGQMRQATHDLNSQLANNPQLRSRFTNDQLQAIQAGESKIPGYTWHHHQDTGRMQLVPERIHGRTGHIGWEAMSQGR